MVSSTIRSNDLADIKARVDLLDLIRADTTLMLISRTDGGEYAGPCPFCARETGHGGRDRLHVKPAAGYWRCRQCGDQSHWEDCFGYIERRESVSFLAAKDIILELINNHTEWETKTPLKVHMAFANPPAESWCVAAQNIALECSQNLWEPVSERALKHLHDRGLADDTLATWSVGYNHLPREIDGLWVAEGITIPWLVDGDVWHIKIRHLASQTEQKYTSVKGGVPLIYGADTLSGRKCAVFTEGEFDTLLLWQEVGYLVGTATLGGANTLLNPRAEQYIRGYNKILLAYDADEAGDRGAYALARMYPLMRPIRVPLGKDICEYQSLSGNVHGWIVQYLPKDLQDISSKED